MMMKLASLSDYDDDGGDDGDDDDDDAFPPRKGNPLSPIES